MDTRRRFGAAAGATPTPRSGARPAPGRRHGRRKCRLPRRYASAVSTDELDEDYWEKYYDVTAERPPWQTVCKAIDLFAAHDEAAAGTVAPGAATANPAHAATADAALRLAVDLGCGAGRDARKLLRAGWRVIAIDRVPASRTALEKYVEPDSRPRLEIVTADLATADIPRCDLVNASLCLPYLAPDAYRAAWGRIMDALGPGARLAAMLFGDRDGGAGEPDMTYLPPERIAADLDDFVIEFWSEKEEDTKTALGEEHHYHLIEVVARRR
jgi:tellurite methyltransferase